MLLEQDLRVSASNPSGLFGASTIVVYWYKGGSLTKKKMQTGDCNMARNLAMVQAPNADPASPTPSRV